MATKLINGVYHVGERVGGGGGGDLPDNIVTYVPANGSEQYPDDLTPSVGGGTMLLEMDVDVTASMTLESISNANKTPKEVYEHIIGGGSVTAVVYMKRLGSDVQTMCIQNCSCVYIGAMDMYAVSIDPGVGEKIAGIQQGADAEPSWDIQ